MRLIKLLPRFRQAYIELRRLEDRETWRRADVEAFQLERLNALWEHARQHTSFYRRLSQEQSLPDRFRSLDEFSATVPIVSKADLLRDHEAFRSETRPAGEWVRTGGSTGEPLSVYWSSEAGYEALRSRYRYYAMWGVDIFDPMAYVWGHSGSFQPGMKGWLARIKQPLVDRIRNRLRLSAYELNSTRLHEYLRQIEDFRAVAVYGYASALELLAAVAEETAFACPSLKLLTLTGETVQPRAVERIEQAFHARATVEYGTVECGPLAHEWTDRQLHVREDMILMETIPAGEERFEIVVTVLPNHAFPLIRYRLADVTGALLAKPECGFATLQKVVGRENDCIITRGRQRLHSARFDAFFKVECEGVRQFRIRQHVDGSLAVLVEFQEGASRQTSGIEERLRKIVEGYAVKVEAVDNIPLTPAGKVRPVQSEMSLSRVVPHSAVAPAPDAIRIDSHVIAAPLTQPTKTQRLREILLRPQLDFLMEAHNGLSAKIAEEAGFAGIWASGLSMSAAARRARLQRGELDAGARDARVHDRRDSRIPILLDGDTGYGNFNNMRRLVRKLEQRGDRRRMHRGQAFPKTNSFINGASQPLADIDEFAGKIKAGKDAQTDEDFVIVARVEALIAGRGMQEALRRAEAYHQAGADAILIHSARAHRGRSSHLQAALGQPVPVVIVPTKYYSTPVELYREYGISLVIWANHLMRSCVTAMQQTAQQIFREQSLVGVEDRIAPLAEVFRIQGAAELEDAERRYLPRLAATTKAIVLAASRGEDLGELTLHHPKCMVEIAGKPLLAHLVDTYRAAGITEIAVVRGYKKETVTLDGITYLDLNRAAGTRSVAALVRALPALEGSCIISLGDVLFKKHIVQLLLEAEGDFVIMADTHLRDHSASTGSAVHVACTQPNSRSAFWNRVELQAIGSGLSEPIHGEWMGFLKVSPAGAVVLRSFLETNREAGDGELPELLSALLRGAIHPSAVRHWRLARRQFG